MGKPVTTRFLNGSIAEYKIEQRIKDVLSSSDSVRVAVAYWGRGAVERLGIDRLANRDVLIICDLMSGACNPNEIRKMRGLLGEERVLTLDDLHAKVWIVDDAVIIGSSNASASGLGFEGDELSGMIEANLFSSDLAVVTDVRNWFDNEVSRNARPIQEKDLLEAERRWLRRRHGRPVKVPVNYRTLLQALKDDAAFLLERNILVWVYEGEDRSYWADNVIETEGKARHISSIDGWEVLKSDDVPRPGAIIIEFSFEKKSGRAKFDGIWEVLKDDPLITKGKQILLLCQKRKTVFGYPLGDKKMWEKAATDAALNSNDEDEWTLEDFSKDFLSRLS